MIEKLKTWFVGGHSPADVAAQAAAAASRLPEASHDQTALGERQVSAARPGPPRISYRVGCAWGCGGGRVNARISASPEAKAEVTPEPHPVLVLLPAPDIALQAAAEEQARAIATTAVAPHSPTVPAPRERDAAEREFIQEAALKLDLLYLEWNIKVTVNGATTAQQMSDAIVVSNGGPKPVLHLDLAAMDRVSYWAVKYARTKMRLGFERLLCDRLEALGTVGDVIQWAQDDDREYQFPTAWPHDACIEPFEADADERRRMTLRVGRLLVDQDPETRRKSAEVASILLSCLGSVTTADRPPLVLRCIDMRVARKKILEAFGPQVTSALMPLLVNHSDRLVRGPWSTRFLKARVIVPGDLVFPDLFPKQVGHADGKGPSPAKT